MKLKSIITASLCGLFANAYAGAMGPISSVDNSMIKPFVSLEGAYTWNSMYPGIVNGVQSTRDVSPWGGRVAGGIALERSDNLHFSGEFGWGSYGHNRFSVASGETASYYFNGFDVLLGAIYSYRQLDFFVKAGAMGENLQGSSNAVLGQYYPGGISSGVESKSFTNSAFLPEIKVGGEYNFYNKLAVSLAYMYVFGTNQSILVDNYIAPGTVNINRQIRGQAPSFNSLMLGLRYYI